MIFFNTTDSDHVLPSREGMILQSFFFQAVISGAIMLIELFSTEHRTFAGIGLEFVWVAGYLYLALLYYTVRQWRHFLLVTSVPWVIFLSFIWSVLFLRLTANWLLHSAHAYIHFVALCTYFTCLCNTFPIGYYRNLYPGLLPMDVLTMQLRPSNWWQKVSIFCV